MGKKQPTSLEIRETVEKLWIPQSLMGPAGQKFSEFSATR